MAVCLAVFVPLLCILDISFADASRASEQYVPETLKKKVAEKRAAATAANVRAIEARAHADKVTRNFYKTGGARLSDRPTRFSRSAIASAANRTIQKIVSAHQNVSTNNATASGNLTSGSNSAKKK